MGRKISSQDIAVIKAKIEKRRINEEYEKDSRKYFSDTKYSKRQKVTTVAWFRSEQKVTIASETTRVVPVVNGLEREEFVRLTERVNPLLRDACAYTPMRVIRRHKAIVLGNGALPICHCLIS